MAFKTSGAEATVDILSHPIVISNKPLMNALQSSFVTPNSDNGICIIDENVRRSNWGTPKAPFKGFRFFFDFLNNASLGKLALCPTVNSELSGMEFENIYRSYFDKMNLMLDLKLLYILQMAKSNSRHFL